MLFSCYCHLYNSTIQLCLSADYATPSGFDKNCVAKVPVMAFILQGRCLWFVRKISTL